MEVKRNPGDKTENSFSKALRKSYNEKGSEIRQAATANLLLIFYLYDVLRIHYL